MIMGDPQKKIIVSIMSKISQFHLTMNFLSFKYNIVYKNMRFSQKQLFVILIVLFYSGNYFKIFI